MHVIVLLLSGLKLKQCGVKVKVRKNHVKQDLHKDVLSNNK